MNNIKPLLHLLDLEHLSHDVITEILTRAEACFDPSTQQLKQMNTLTGLTLANIFYEPSTRTRSTFELAAKRLNANVLNLNIQASSTKKGESLLDTIRNLEAMQCDLFVLRHPSEGAAAFVAKHVKSHVGVINAGDGCHAHPTQALLDAFTIQKHKGPISELSVAIVGDVLHSRVARSQIHMLHQMRARSIRIIGPRTLLPSDGKHLGVQVETDIKKGLEDIDVIIMLRLQLERQQKGLIPSGHRYYQHYGLTEETLQYANPNALVIHPGPINRGIEIQSEIADGPQAVILDQVKNGIAVRMSVLSILSENHRVQK